MGGEDSLYLVAHLSASLSNNYGIIKGVSNAFPLIIKRLLDQVIIIIIIIAHHHHPLIMGGHAALVVVVVVVVVSSS